jgi:hypothetical protein
MKVEFAERKHKYLLHKNADKTIEILDQRIGRKEKAISLLSEHEQQIEDLIKRRITHGVLNLQDLQRN